MVALPRLQTEIIEAALAAEPVVEVVGQVAADAAGGAVAVSGAHVAILADGDTLPALALDLLAVDPRLKVVAITGSGRHAALYECQPAVTPLGEVSPRALVDAILDAVGRGRPEAPR
jgi:hypothetical protein